MSLIKNKTSKLVLILGLVMIILAIVFAFNVGVVNAQEINPISDRSELLSAINNAEDGDVIYVGDIDFGLPDLPNALVINKSITIRGLKDDESNVVFTNGNFLIDGLAKCIDVKIENIDFVGNNQNAKDFLLDNITEIDCVMNKSSYVAPGVRRNIFSALSLTGDINAEIVNCSFSGYVSTLGGAISGDNSSVDTVSKHINMSLKDVNFNNNAAFAGGAIYISGRNKNVCVDGYSLHIIDNYALKGGGFYLGSGTIDITASEISKNCAQESSQITFEGAGNGGGILAEAGSTINVVGSKIVENTAKNGAGLYINKSLAILNGFVLAGNVATNIGGGMYVNTDNSNPTTLINGSIYKNTAFEGAGVGFVLNFGNMGNINFYLCTYCFNDTTGYSSFELYGQMFAHTVGNIFIDGTYEGFWGEDDDGNEVYYEFEEEIPSQNNGYNYVGTIEQAEKYGIGYTDEQDYDVLLLDGTDNFDVIPSSFLPSAVGRVYGDVKPGNNARLSYEVIIQSEGKYVVGYGEEFSPSAPSKKGHTFTKWILGDGTTVDFDKINFGIDVESIEIIPVYEPNRYTITFILNENRQTTVSATYGEAVKLPSVESEGYNFLGWYFDINDPNSQFISGSEYTFEGDLTLYACFRKKFPLATVLGAVFGGLAVIGLAIIVVIIAKKHKKKESKQPSVNKAKALPDTSILTDREKQVLDLLLEGKKRSEVAKRLFVSEETVKKQITSIYQKLEVSSRAELFAKFR